MEIDVEKLRKDLIDYFGSASGFFPMSIMDVAEVENASASKLVKIAKDNGFDLNQYSDYSR